MKGNPIPFFGDRIPKSIRCARIATIYLANKKSLLTNSSRIFLAERVRFGSRRAGKTDAGLDNKGAGAQEEGAGVDGGSCAGHEGRREKGLVGREDGSVVFVETDCDLSGCAWGLSGV